MKSPIRTPWRSVGARAALGVLLVSACRSEQSAVQSISSNDDFDASESGPDSGEPNATQGNESASDAASRSEGAADAAAAIALNDAGGAAPPLSETLQPAASETEQSDSATTEGVSETSLTDARSDTGLTANNDAGELQICEPGTILCSDTGGRMRCADDGSGFEGHGSCALELFDGFDSDAVYVRRADGQFAYLSDAAPPTELNDVIGRGQTVRRVIADTDPAARSSPWLLDLDGALWDPLQSLSASSVLSAHISHGFTVTVAADGTVTSLLSGIQMSGDFIAALGHEENLWLLSSDGRLSAGLDAFALTEQDWLPTLPAEYQRVFVLDQELCGLRTDGEVDCAPTETWQGLIPEGPFVDLSCNFRTCYGLRADGTVACWSAQFECVPHDGPFLDIATAAQLVCGINEQRGVHCWYHNGTAVDVQWIAAAYR